MAFDVSTFRANLLNDGARPSLFQVTIPFPTGAYGGAAVPPVVGAGGVNALNATGSLSFVCRAASLPADSISSIVIPYFGREIKVAGTRTFSQWSVTIINDESFSVRNNLEVWMNTINSHVGNIRSPGYSPPASYQTDAIVTQYGKTGPQNVIKRYTLVGAFPTDVAAIDLDWALGDQIEEYTVTFDYQWWVSNTTT
jgi:hypothetical protein